MWRDLNCWLEVEKGKKRLAEEMGLTDMVNDIICVFLPSRLLVN